MKKKTFTERFGEVVGLLLALAFPLFFLFVFVRMIVYLLLGIPFDSNEY